MLNSVPKDVKVISILMVCYGVGVLLNALMWGLQHDFSDQEGLFRAAIRCGGMVFLAVWLLRLEKNAWWFSTGACGIFMCIGGLALFAGFKSVVFILALFPVISFFLLMRPSVRSLFFDKS